MFQVNKTYMPYLNTDSCYMPLVNWCEKEIKYKDELDDYKNDIAKGNLKFDPYLLDLDKCLKMARCLNDTQ